MFSESDFRCPVCRARQRFQDSCRRCRADLRLAVRVRRRIGFLVQEIRNARASGQQQRAETLRAELRWLAPQLDRQ